MSRQPSPSQSRGRVCVIRQHYVPQDTRVARAVAALAASGCDVDVICLRNRGEPRLERDGRVLIWRVPLRHPRGRGAGGYLAAYGGFFLVAASLATALHARHRYRLLQVHSLPHLLGARVLLDLQECMPEVLATKFGTPLGHPAVRLVAALEQRSIRFADLVTTPSEEMAATFIARGADEAKITVVMDGADEDVFRPPPLPASRAGPRFTLICHGTVEERYGLDLVLRAVALLRGEIPELRFEVYGDGSYLDELRRLAVRLGVEDRVYFSGGFVPVDELVGAIAAADVGVVAMKRDPFRDVTLAGKIFDFIALRRPVVASRTRSLERAFDACSVELFESEDVEDLARAIRVLHADPERRRRMAERAAEVAEPYRWVHQRKVYLRVVERLLDGGGPR